MAHQAIFAFNEQFQKAIKELIERGLEREVLCAVAHTLQMFLSHGWKSQKHFDSLECIMRAVAAAIEDDPKMTADYILSKLEIGVRGLVQDLAPHSQKHNR